MISVSIRNLDPSSFFYFFETASRAHRKLTTANLLAAKVNLGLNNLGSYIVHSLRFWKENLNSLIELAVCRLVNTTSVLGTSSPQIGASGQDFCAPFLHFVV